MTTKNTILLIIRVVAGGLLAFQGIDKLMHMPDKVLFFASLGLAAGIAWAVAIVETLAGLGLVFGVFTRLSALGSVIIMIGAMYYVGADWKNLVVGIGSLIVLFTGAGQYALCRGKKAVVAPVAAAQPVSSVPPSSAPQM